MSLQHAMDLSLWTITFQHSTNYTSIPAASFYSSPVVLTDVKVYSVMLGVVTGATELKRSVEVVSETMQPSLVLN